MFGFGKKTVPEWANVLDKKEYAAFNKALEHYFASKGEPYAIGDGIVKLKDSWEFGLSNLVQTCARGNIGDYPAIIAHHFGLMLEGKAFEEEFSKNAANFDYVKQYLAVRLYDEDYLSAMGGDTFVRRHFAGELYAALVWDFPTVLQNVKQSEIDAWGLPLDTLFEIGLDNVRQNYEIEAGLVDIGDDKLHIFTAEHFFVPNMLFDLAQKQDVIGRGGAIIAAPTRSLVMAYPIEDMKVVNALTSFFVNAPKFYNQGPGSLTTEVYWYHDGEFEPLNYEGGENIKFTPSEAFLALLNGGLE